jgi:hypothetical protein
MDRSKAPVFVLGSPRSGTTFLYNTILSAGNFAVYLAESDIFNQIVPAFGDMRSRANRRRLLNAFFVSDYFKRTGLKPEEIEGEVLSDCRNAGDFLRIFMERMAKNQGVERWAENTPPHLLQIPQIKANIPNALFVHIIRDGRDAAMSLARLRPWGPGRSFPWDRNQGLLLSAIHWDWLVRKGREHGRKLGPDYMEVRFEELVERPREVLKVLSGFIQQDMDYERIQKNAIGAAKARNTSFEGQSNPVGRWKDLGAVELRRLNALIGPLLRELGYEVSGPEQMDFTAWRLRAFYRALGQTREIVKRTPFSKFVISKQCLKPGYLDRLSRWKGASY